MPRRYWLPVLAALALVLTLPAQAERLVQRDGVWPQTYTGRAADPSIRFGQLPNGLRYAIQRNATPPGQMALRMYIGSGSLAETDQEQGLAHFLEHMAFRGSTHLADGEMIKILARYGLTFGADTNASTGQQATIYKLDFPKAGGADIDTGLMLFREIAGHLNLSPSALDAERGVILSEERLRDTPSYREAKGLINFLLPGQLATRRWPIGLTQVVRDATPAQLRGYYEREYRPDNAVIVAAGDFDPDAVEAAIRQRFSDWKPRGEGAVARPATGTVQPRSEQVGLYSEAGAPQSVQISWVQPYDDSADTDAHQDANDLRSIATLIINHRFEDLAQQPDAPFVAAELGHAGLLKSADVTSLTVMAPAERWQAAMKAALDEQRRAVRFGVTQAEIQRAMTEFRSYLTAAAASASTRETPKLADRIVRDLGDNDVTRSPEQDLAEMDALAAKVTPDTINAALREMFSGSGPLLFLSTPQPPAGGAPAVRRALDDALRDPVTEQAASVATPWPYQDFGEPGKVVERHEVTDLGMTQVRFANGTTLIVKPTAFTRDQVLTVVGFGAGRLGLPSDMAHAYWLVGGQVPAFIESGTGKLPGVEVQRALAAHASTLQFSMRDDAFTLAGHTQPANLDFMLQLEAAYLTDPGFRPEPVERYKAALASILPQIDATATGVLGREKAVALHGGDRRWTTIPRAADVQATRPEDLRALLQQELRRRPPSVIVVGDIGVDQAIAGVAKTLGALPATGVAAAEPGTGAPARFPADVMPLAFSHHGRADQALALTAWPTTDYFTSPAETRALLVASGIVKQRLVEGLRETDGATYSPLAEVEASQTMPGYGYFAVAVEIPPAKIPLFQKRLADSIADLREHDVSADELERARAPLVQSRLRDQQTNVYWANMLTNEARDPRTLEVIRSRVSGMQAVTADDVRAVVRKYLAGAGRTLTVSPAGEKSAP